MPTLSYSTSGFHEDDLPTALAGIAQVGFRHIELAADPHAMGPTKRLTDLNGLLTFLSVTLAYQAQRPRIPQGPSKKHLEKGRTP